MVIPFDSGREIAADLDTPVSALLKLRPLDPVFLLESVAGGERVGRYSFIGLGARDEIELSADRMTVNGEARPTDGDPLGALAAWLRAADLPGIGARKRSSPDASEYFISLASDSTRLTAFSVARAAADSTSPWIGCAPTSGSGRRPRVGDIPSTLTSTYSPSSA